MSQENQSQDLHAKVDYIEKYIRRKERQEKIGLVIALIACVPMLGFAAYLVYLIHSMSASLG